MSREIKIVMIVVFASSLVLIPGITTNGRLGAGILWLVHSSNYYLMGAEGRMGFPIAKNVKAFLEVGHAKALNDDDVATLLDGSLVVYIASNQIRPYFGLGLGFARWEDTGGWDSGVSYQAYSRLTGGMEMTFFHLPFFIQGSATFYSWFNPILAVGFYF